MKKILSIILLAIVSVSFVAAANVDVYNNVKVGVGIFNGQRTLNIKSGDSSYAIDASEVKRTDLVIASTPEVYFTSNFGIGSGLYVMIPLSVTSGGVEKSDNKIILSPAMFVCGKVDVTKDFSLVGKVGASLERTKSVISENSLSKTTLNITDLMLLADLSGRYKISNSKKTTFSIEAGCTALMPIHTWANSETTIASSTYKTEYTTKNTSYDIIPYVSLAFTL